MKKSLFLALLSAAVALPSVAYTTTTLMLPGVAEGDWYDITKYNLRSESDPSIYDASGKVKEDSLTCGSVTASNMLAYYRSQQGEEVTDAIANLIYDAIFDMQGDSEATAYTVLNKYCSTTYGATGDGIAAAVGINSGSLTNLNELTVTEGYATPLYTNMTLLDAVQWGVANNTAMGLTMVIPSTGQSHALTVWGAEITDYGNGTQTLTGLYFTNSDNVNTADPNGKELQKASITTSVSGNETIYMLNDNANRSWKIVELNFLLDPYSMSEKPEDTNPLTISSGSADFSTGGAEASGTSFNFTTAGTLNIGAGKTLYSTRLSGSAVSLKGAGTYVAEDFSMGNASVGSTWSGTVRLTGYYTGKNKGEGLTADGINSVANAASLVELKGASTTDFDSNSVVLTRKLRLTNQDANNLGFELLAVSGTDTVELQGAVSGTGDWAIQNDSGVSTAQHYRFTGDVSHWSGEFVSRLDAKGQADLDFGNNTLVNASVLNAGAGQMSVAYAKNTTINGNLTKTGTGALNVTAADGDRFTGTLDVTKLTLNGKVSIGPSDDAAVLASAPAGETSVSAIGAETLYFSAGSTLELDGNYTLDGQNITLADDYISAMQAANVNTVELITAGSGQTLSGSSSVALSNSLDGTGYRLLSTNGSVMLTNGTIDSLSFRLSSAYVSWGVLYLQLSATDAANIAELDLNNIGTINIYLDGDLIRNLYGGDVNADSKVELSLNYYYPLTNVSFYSDGSSIGYSGEGDGFYRLGNVPEPATGTLSLLALAALAARRPPH